MSKLIEQYRQIKLKYLDTILLFRVGDFYETFNEDARTVAEMIGVLLTENTDSEYVKVSASIPIHDLDHALQKLVRKGFSVAICEELEDPRTAKDIPKRGVTDLLK